MELGDVAIVLRGFARGVGNLRHCLAAICLRVLIEGSPPQESPPILADAARLLLLRVDEIGDFILTIPFLRCIRNRFPGAWITIVVNAKVLPLASDCPYVDEVIGFETASTSPPFDQFVALVRAWRFALRCLAHRRFDCAIIPRADVDGACTAAMAYFAGIRYRVGFAENVTRLKRVKNAGYDRFLTHRLGEVSGTHEVEWCLGIAAYFGADIRDSRLELWPSATARAAAAAALGRFRLRGAPLVAVAPGAGLGRRRWPIERYVSVVAALTRGGAQVVILGGAEDQRLAAQLHATGARGQGEVLNLAGGIKLDEAAAVMGLCDLFLGNDSGPMHLAAAMGTPTVVVSCHPRNGDASAANSPSRFGPWGVKSRVLQPAKAISPCRDSCVKVNSHCITAVSNADVLAAVAELLVWIPLSPNVLV